MLAQSRISGAAGCMPLECAAFALKVENAAGLSAAFIHRGHEEPAARLGVGVGAGRGDEHGTGALDPVLHGRELARPQILDRGLDDQLTGGDQGTQWIGGTLSTGFLFQCQNPVLQAVAPLVEEGLAGHAGQLHHVLGRAKAQRGVLQRRFPGTGAGEDEHRYRFGHLAADGRQVAQQLVGSFAHEAAGLVVGQNVFQKVRGFPQCPCLSGLGIGELYGRWLRGFGSFFQPLFAEPDQPIDIGVDSFFGFLEEPAEIK